MARRLNPFALPAETTLRFVLLIVAVVGTSLFVFNWLYFSLSDSRREVARYAVCVEAERIGTATTGDPAFGNEALGRCLAPIEHRKGRIVLAGTGGILLLGGAAYLAWPLLKRRRRGLRPLAPDVPQVTEAVAALSRQAGLRRAPEVLWNPLRTGGGALAFGLPWRPAIALSAGLVASWFRDRAAFDAVVRHELAHLRNGDVATTYLAVAVWWSLVVAGVVPLLISLPASDAGTVGKILWRLAALTALAYLTRNAILRSREAYADVRAVEWDGRDGALRRVLAALPARSGGWLSRFTSVHPDPAARRRLVDAPDGLFRFGIGEAFAAGAAAGIAFPNLVNVLSLLTIGTPRHVDARAYAALLVAPFVAGVLVIAAWRSAQEALARGLPTPRTLWPAAALAAGLALGQTLSLDAIANSGGGVADIGGAAYWALWIALLVGLVLLFARWLMLTAEAWMPLARRSPRLVLAAAVAVAALVLAWALGQLAAISEFIDALRRFDGWQLLVPDAGALGSGLLDLVAQKDVTFAVLVAVWAFPLAGWLLRPRDRALGAWAYLDPGPAVAYRTVPPAVRRALGIAAIAAAAFLALLVGWRSIIHATVDVAERDTDAYILSFAYRVELVAVIVQAGVAFLVAWRARGAGVLVALMAAFAAGVVIVAAWLGVTRAAGCVEVITIRPGSVPCPAPMETSFMWTTLKDWVNEGQLLALVAVPAGVGARRLLTAARRLPAVDRPAA